MMETSSPNNERLIGELIKGIDSTKKLQNLLRRKTQHHGSVSAEDLVMKILGSFSDSLSVLTSSSSGDSHPVSATTNYVDSAFSDESEKKPAPDVKDRRGCYKRRKTENSWVKIVDTFEDGYEWRKYGQKVILNAKYPRCYFKCANKNKGCKALKQVQKLEDGSKMFHITYVGHHTCQNLHKNTHMVSDSGAHSVFLHNFGDSNINNSSTSPSIITNVQNTPLMEQEYDSNAQSDDHMVFNTNHGQSSIPTWKDMIGELASSHEEIFNNGGYFGGGFKFEENIFLQV